MPEKIMPEPVCDLSNVREAVCVHTKKIFDSCRDKDCMEDLRFYPTVEAQAVLSGAQATRGGLAELLYVYTNVEPVSFHRGYYAVDMRFFYRVTLQVYNGTPRYTEVEGLCVFDKRTILFGSEGNAKIFTSDMAAEELEIPMASRSNLPTAVVTAVDPLVLSSRLGTITPGGVMLNEIPAFIAAAFGSELVLTPEGTTGYFITLGQFTLVRLERDTQLLIPVYDYCIPQCDCNTCGGGGGTTVEDPCCLFDNVPFPVNEFFPPNTVEVSKDYATTRAYYENKT